MAILSYPIVRVLIRGTISGTQTWSAGFACSSSTVPTATQLQTFVTSIAGTPFTTFITATSGLRTFMATGLTRVDRMDAYYIPANSRVATLSATAALVNSNTGTGTGVQPAQSCVVASLRTNTPGRSGRGRMYFPADGLALSSVGQIAQGNANALSSSLAAYFTAVNATALGAGSVNVVVPTSKFGAPFTVTRVVVDTETDIQRRHANKLVATGSASTSV
jgi:hypothetical protein